MCRWCSSGARSLAAGGGTWQWPPRQTAPLHWCAPWMQSSPACATRGCLPAARAVPVLPPTLHSPTRTEQTPEEPSLAQRVVAFKDAFWKFLRPHTIRGTILGSCAVTAKALLENPQARAAHLLGGPGEAQPVPAELRLERESTWRACAVRGSAAGSRQGSATPRPARLAPAGLAQPALPPPAQLIDWGLLPRAVLGVLALLCGNGYIVGINQIYDVEIDKTNKPFLPVAAGELSAAAAWALCGALAAGGLALTAAHFGRLITGLYGFGLFLGTIYSVPPLRLKRSAVAAFVIIATVRGFLLNFGVYYATRAALGLPFTWSPSIRCGGVDRASEWDLGGCDEPSCFG